MKKLVLFGSGKRCKRLCNILKGSNYEVVAILDSNPDRWGEEVIGYKIEPPKIIKNFLNAYLCITVADFNAIKKIREDITHISHYKLENEINYTFKKFYLKYMRMIYI